jgi:5-amino-6-(5-phospho-D-ribitylamino)uracil phosphatase
MKYKLIAIDLDGTLLDADHAVNPRTRAALLAARRAGLAVCLATGRSYVETLPIWRDLALEPPYEPLILIGGTLVCEPDTGRTLWQQSIAADLARQYADALAARGYSAMAIVDAWRWGVDYYLAESADAEIVRRDWFAKMDVTIRRVAHLAGDGSMPNPLRITAVAAPDEAAALAESLKESFGGRLNIHAIRAPNYGVTIVEAFALQADKAAGLRYVAQGRRLSAAQTVAIGDDINDLAMIRQAGLGVAMPNAPQAVRAVADAVAEGGLAQFLDDLLAGRYD